MIDALHPVLESLEDSGEELWQRPGQALAKAAEAGKSAAQHYIVIIMREVDNSCNSQKFTKIIKSRLFIIFHFRIHGRTNKLYIVHYGPGTISK